MRICRPIISSLKNGVLTSLNQMDVYTSKESM